MAGPALTWLVVPTRGDHPDLLAGLADLGYPTVVVRTADCPVPAGVFVVDDHGPVSIQRWWNAGLDAAQMSGARWAVVVNDDVSLPPDAPAEMAARLEADGAWLCGADPDAMTGWCWALDLDSPLRPDEGFRWWFGDNDLWLRAERDGRLTGVNVGAVHHHPNEATERSPELTALAREDEAVFRRKWG